MVLYSKRSYGYKMSGFVNFSVTSTEKNITLLAVMYNHYWTNYSSMHHIQSANGSAINFTLKCSKEVTM